ncbi:MAG: methionine sulfoxide reductase catalytic subunit [Acidobacteriota bacterium]|jgi:sulfoxide reductase catalytic subunit YedY|nr:methionine sulfoxide reductase catalytic subunit [Acidobacteriota bacterium]
MLIPEREATPESVYLSRRTFLASALAVAACAGPPRAEVARTIPPAAAPYPVPRNNRFTLDCPLTDELTAAAYNNFYEITPTKEVWRGAGSMAIDPWSVEVTGLVARPRRFSLDELLRIMPLEERLYRHRCVEAWSMAVPWSGFPLAHLLAMAEPAHAARYVRFVSMEDRERQHAIAGQASYPWPYHEALRIDEAMHELTFLATGIYGHALPKQHGAPIRLVVPWKYGYKSAKSIVRIELVAERPTTFWEAIAPVEYPFESNVDPARPHPRWSQWTEKLLGTGDIKRTLPFNGYAALVQSLYP